jgi:hypothetical protein
MVSVITKSNSPRIRVSPFAFPKRRQFFTARTTKRFPSPRCASAIQIARKKWALAEAELSA